MMPGWLVAFLFTLLQLSAGANHSTDVITASEARYLDLDDALTWLGSTVVDDLVPITGPTRQLQQLQQHQQRSATSRTSQRAVEKRCRGTQGSWCVGYNSQPPAPPPRPAPRGNRTCPRNCSGVGNCNHDTGTCDCPAGSQGPDCGSVLLRPCTTHFRHRGDVPAGHIDAEGRDLGLTDEGYTESRCTGICDPVTARCFCDGKYRRVNPPPGSPPGTPAPVRGRPLPNHVCQVSDDGKGNKLEWGQVPWQQIYGPDGWCNSDKPVINCGCMFDGFSGELCDEVTETMCPNQCSGHGECDSGFCKCHAGWYGTDCARKAAGLRTEPGLHETGSRPWLTDTVRVSPEAALAAATTATTATTGAAVAGTTEASSKLAATAAAAAGAAGGGAVARKRPLIYVYDLPPAYNARMLQYRNDRGLCTWRTFGSGNASETFGWTYGLEVLMHEMMLQSEHRTFDPDQADFFYVPVYGSCFIYPVHCYADGPWWHVPSGPRVMHVTNMMLEVRDWIRQHFPFWDRRGGRDHIWLMTHDEGACYAPTEIYNTSILLTHWGRTDPSHTSNTAYTPDNYTQEFLHPQQPGGWLGRIAGHPCYTPGKDLVIPALKLPPHYSASPLLFHPPRHRPTLLFLRGDVGKTRLPNYSRGIRQRLYELGKLHDWRSRYAVLIGDGSDVPGSYSEQLASSRFCVVAPGDGWSARMEDAVLHGCIPVIIMDGVSGVWEEQLALARASVRVREGELEGLPERLAAIPERVVAGMQRRLRRFWHRYAYASHPLLAKQMKEVIKRNVEVWKVRGGGQQQQPHNDDNDDGFVGGFGGAGAGGGGGSSSSSSSSERRQKIAERLAQRAAFPVHDDAFNTILQWLHSRIPDTR